MDRLKSDQRRPRIELCRPDPTSPASWPVLWPPWPRKGLEGAQEHRYGLGKKPVNALLCGCEGVKFA